MTTLPTHLCFSPLAENTLSSLITFFWRHEARAIQCRDDFADRLGHVRAPCEADRIHVVISANGERIVAAISEITAKLLASEPGLGLGRRSR